MTNDGEFKALVRERMSVTGENYTTAMRHVLDAARRAVPDSDPGRQTAGAMLDAQGTAAPADPEMTLVRRPFDAAYRRMLECTSLEELPDELSNMLQHFYRLGELRKRRWRAADPTFTEKVFITRVLQVPGAVGARWIRTYDTHEIATVSRTADVYASLYTAMYGVLVWKPIADTPFVNEPAGSDQAKDYQAHLANKVTFDTLRAAFYGLAALP